MFRIGQGWDFHRFAEDGDAIYLGSVKVPSKKAVIAHSDGDVLLHALMDAILGALALGDIGILFPDNDLAYKGISSRVLLKEVLKHLVDSSYSIVNIDITLLFEYPKVKPFREKIIQNLSQLLKINGNAIGLKATTTEKMGALGREEGVACSVVVLLQKNATEARKTLLADKVPERIEKQQRRNKSSSDDSCLGNPKTASRIKNENMK